MADLSETETYETGIYQLETSDKLMGGAEGISNRQAIQLANRTAWLKAHNLTTSSGTFTATLHMHNDPTNITDTNVTASETGSYVRIGDMVWITLGATVTQYDNHTLKHITGLPFAAATPAVFTVGTALGVRFRWRQAGAGAARLHAHVSIGSVRIEVAAVQTNSNLYESFWEIMNRPGSTKNFQMSGWYQASAEA